ncbi:hypothetical protein ACE6H2_016853 [Prunus campanulata]
MQGFDTFVSSLKDKSFRPNKEGSGVDLVLSCVDNYEARMSVNQNGSGDPMLMSSMKSH